FRSVSRREISPRGLAHRRAARALFCRHDGRLMDFPRFRRETATSRRARPGRAVWWRCNRDRLFAASVAILILRITLYAQQANLKWKRKSKSAASRISPTRKPPSKRARMRLVLSFTKKVHVSSRLNKRQRFQ